jgi:hypothetical protein
MDDMKEIQHNWINNGKFGGRETETSFFNTACIYNRVVIIDRLSQLFPFTKLRLNDGLYIACQYNHLSLVNYLLNLPVLDLSREEWECFRAALNNKDETIAIRFLQDARIPKNEIVRRWAYGKFDQFDNKGYRRKIDGKHIINILRDSRLRMMVMYSKGFSRMSGLPKELVHLISSYTEPYHIEELKQFASFVEKIERCRSF